MFPIIKDKNKDIADTDNYRGITVASVVSKLCERVILFKWEDLMQSVIINLGSRKVLVVQNVLMLFKKLLIIICLMATKYMLACALDLSKAYD